MPCPNQQPEYAKLLDLLHAATELVRVSEVWEITAARRWVFRFGASHSPLPFIFNVLDMPKWRHARTVFVSAN